MKKFLISIFLVLALATIFTGCSLKDTASKVKDKIDPSSDHSAMEQSNILNSDTQSQKITAEKAKEIAFSHSGVNPSDVRDLDVDLDRDGGVLHYDIDFEVGTTDYEYEINAENGNIIHSNKDID